MTRRRALTPAAIRAAIGPARRELVCAGCVEADDERLGKSLAPRRCRRCGGLFDETVVVQMPVAVVRRARRGAAQMPAP